jgi:myo-inositol catabolism protein IolH
MISRRNLLKGVAGGVGGLWVGAVRRVADAAEPPAAKKPMTLSVDSTMFGRHKRPEVWGMIRTAGYRYVEVGISHFRSHEIDSASVEKLRTELSDAGLHPVAAFIVHRFSSPDEAMRQKAVDNWRRSIDATGQLGVKLITTELTGDLAQRAASEVSFRKSMDVLLPVLEKTDIHLSVEPHPGDFIEAASPLIKILRGFGSRHLGYLHCMPHTFFLGDSRAVIEEAGPLLTHLHVADTYRRERLIARAGVGLHMHLRPPLGEVDCREVFDALATIGYQGCASVQLLSHLDDPVGTARQTREYLDTTFPHRFQVGKAAP